VWNNAIKDFLRYMKGSEGTKGRFAPPLREWAD